MVLEEVTQTFRSARALQIDLGVRRGDVKLPIRQGRCRSISEGLVPLRLPSTWGLSFSFCRRLANWYGSDQLFGF
ncbi:hypothetical protein GBA52_008253 [Prunus armeniaca]|nr:hypothetical protein GBA52_008253 [Prunus armeniaca]